jgi:hypothetical protein
LKLAGISTACALMAGAGALPTAAARSCALAAAIGLIASFWYYRLWLIRSQKWTGGPYGPAMLAPRGEPDAEGANTYQKHFAQEDACDSIRCVSQTA